MAYLSTAGSLLPLALTCCTHPTGQIRHCLPAVLTAAELAAERTSARVMAAATGTVSAGVRRILAGNANQPMRLAVIFERLKLDHPTLTRTHFREKVVRQMFLRDEVRARADPTSACEGHRWAPRRVNGESPCLHSESPCLRVLPFSRWRKQRYWRRCAARSAPCMPCGCATRPP